MVADTNASANAKGSYLNRSWIADGVGAELSRGRHQPQHLFPCVPIARFPVPPSPPSLIIAHAPLRSFSHPLALSLPRPLLFLSFLCRSSFITVSTLSSRSCTRLPRPTAFGTRHYASIDCSTVMELPHGPCAVPAARVAVDRSCLHRFTSVRYTAAFREFSKFPDSSARNPARCLGRSFVTDKRRRSDIPEPAATVLPAGMDA